MRARLAATPAVLVAVALLAVACGGNSRRDSVVKYIDQVNKVDVQMRASLSQVAKGSKRVASGGLTGKESQQRATEARQSLEQLSRQLHALHPPQEARRLHRQLLALVGAEVGVAREVEGLTTFLPRLQRALAPVAPAQQKLNRALKRARKALPQAVALEAYVRELAGPLAAVRAIDAPPVTASLRDTQAATLARVRTTAAALAAGLRAKRAKAIPRLERDFIVAARTGGSLSAQRARIAGVRAYNARIRRLTTLAARVQKERDRLQRTL